MEISIFIEAYPVDLYIHEMHVNYAQAAVEKLGNRHVSVVMSQ